jgi:membrane-associated phospholipid phosphatase
MKFSKVNYLLIGFILLWVILALFFGIYDLQISIFVVDEISVWGEFGALYGEIPGYALIAAALTIFLGGFIKKIAWQKIFAFIALGVGVIYLAIGMLSSDTANFSLGFLMILSLSIIIIITWNKDLSKYRKLSGIISALSIINPLLFTQLVKIFWGRVRFRDLAPGFSNYTPWFIPRGITGNQSFPSGHAAMSTMFLPLIIYFKRKQMNISLKAFFIIVIIVWGLFVAFSRVVIGAHFASDVLFSSMVAVIFTIYAYKRFYNNEST